MPISTLLQQLADTLNALQDAGYEPDPRNGVYIGPGRGLSSLRHNHRLFLDDETGRWTVTTH